MQQRSRRWFLDNNETYVSRAAYKLASVSDELAINFKDKVVLDVGSSSGGFTQFAIINGAIKVIAVEKGTDQLHASLRGDPQIELHEKTDIRSFKTNDKIDLVLIDVSFVSLREILPALKSHINNQTVLIAMAKPHFETRNKDQMNQGIIKNERIRREILADFEHWLKNEYLIISKADSKVAGTKGNKERFYKLKVINKA